ncbi:MAG: Asp-tRNA(Asn)/Glu-tRNA(Gln) amidotransferase subunit GatC [Candidatus ainarchaeum sp.]|jgi:aspartyl-tRNA(Asn)/glutamyl-tRNA(Gln) amidotransferase subunit C|nr:Asp-tRNA(Asn)/Glu-tRNA(Gln) amidotransferase subunit GatC [Candidatus ainarchaeum sp.]MDD4468176.1 Asp-tRNA(Asn)/Glu-tRNA(Gln) amidotransferase subunit GatC [Candidatus ainarchaeum sp.]HPM85809.1 Asp-tRNA(Asn)/Glu-tRNA(Gln) amidotransferase subunit GatC [archaeon]
MVQVEVTIELIKKVAKNARLNLTDEELEKFVPQIKEIILDSFNKLNEFDAKGVKPSFQPVEVSNKFRGDEVKEGVTQEEALSNVVAKLKEEGYFKGPKAM